MKRTTKPSVDEKFENYPDFVREKMQFLRELVIETAREIDGLEVLVETLKWNEPSFLTKNGSTLRMDWKEKTPNQYALYFQCTSRLVDTFRMVFNQTFQYETNRAIVFHIDQKIPVKEVKQCMKAALTYHSVKHLELLGL